MKLLLHFQLSLFQNLVKQQIVLAIRCSMYSALLLHHLHTFLQVEPIQILTQFLFASSLFYFVETACSAFNLTYSCFVFLKHNIKNISTLSRCAKASFCFFEAVFRGQYIFYIFWFRFFTYGLKSILLSRYLCKYHKYSSFFNTCLASATQRCASAPSSVSGRPKSVVI